MTTSDSVLRKLLGNRDVRIVEGSLENALQGTGVRKVAEYDGVSLWAEIFNGRALAYRAFDQKNNELPVLVVTIPSPKHICAAVGDGGSICWPECADAGS
jgi:hypothetical protein